MKCHLKEGTFHPKVILFSILLPQISTSQFVPYNKHFDCALNTSIKRYKNNYISNKILTIHCLIKYVYCFRYYKSFAKVFLNHSNNFYIGTIFETKYHLSTLSINLFYNLLHTTQNSQNKWTKILGLETKIFDLKMMEKNGLEFFILKFYQPLQRFLLTCQANSAFLGSFFCTGQQQL